MTGPLSLRARLTLVVTAVFAATMVLTAIVGMQSVRGELLSDARSNAEDMLRGYLAGPDAGDATSLAQQFFYLDAEGNEISTAEFLRVTVGDDPFFAGLEDLDDDAFFDGGVSVSTDAGGFDPDVDQLPMPDIGEVRSIDLGDEMVSVVQPITFDGVTVQVGVSMPLRPVTDSIDAFRRLLWIAVPALTALVGLIIWLVTGRALAPVHSISRRVKEITASNIDERVPTGGADDEIGELATTMNEMLARLQQTQERQRQLVSDASHELRSPIAASRVQLEVAAAHPESANWETTAAVVLAEQERLGALVDDLLALTRLDERQPTILADVDLDDVVTAEAQRPRRVPVRAVIDHPARIIGDPSLLTRMIRNLVDNATRHARDQVVVRLRTDEGFVVIEVDDDGPGIPLVDRERVFDRFIRLDEARNRGCGGAGLGLAIVREAAAAAGGSVTVLDSDLGGARFALSLPLQTA